MCLFCCCFVLFWSLFLLVVGLLLLLLLLFSFSSGFKTTELKSWCQEKNKQLQCTGTQFLPCSILAKQCIIYIQFWPAVALADFNATIITTTALFSFSEHRYPERPSFSQSCRRVVYMARTTQSRHKYARCYLFADHTYFPSRLGPPWT